MSGFRGRGGRGSGRGGGRGGAGSPGRVVAVMQSSGGTLSDRFAQIRQQATSSGAVAKNARVAANVQRSSNQRQAAFAVNRRGRGAPVSVVVTPRGRGRGGAKPAGRGGVKITGKLAAASGAPRGGGRGGRGARGGRGRGRGGRGGARPAPVRSAEDMDLELEQYQGVWISASMSAA
jgi:C-terminal duplication domain of Friend of PRMT1